MTRAIPPRDKRRGFSHNLMKKRLSRLLAISAIAFGVNSGVSAAKTHETLFVENNAPISLENIKAPQRQLEIGKNYLKGVNGFPRDEAQAYGWLMESAKAGNAQAQLEIYLLHVSDASLEQRGKEGLPWLTKASDSGLAKAQFLLAMLHDPLFSEPEAPNQAKALIQALEVKPDAQLALRLYINAAEQNFTDAQMALGVMLHDGDFVRQNKEEAKRWFGKACDNGIAFGCKLYREL